MNYMPDMAHFAFPRSAAPRITLTSLRAHLERLLPYTKMKPRSKKSELWVDGGANGATVELLPHPKRPLNVMRRANPGLEPAEQIIRLCSGPNHDYTYLPIYYDVELALLQFPGIVRIYAEGEIRPLEAMRGHFEWVAGRLAELGCKDTYDDIFYADVAAAMLRLTEQFPEIAMTPEVTPWLLRGLVGDDDARAEGIADYLLEKRPKEALPRLASMIRDPENEGDLERLLALYGQLARLPEGAAPTPYTPDDDELAQTRDDDPWARWIARYLLACHDHPRPLLDGLRDPAEAQALLELADMSVFIERTQDFPDFSEFLDDYIDNIMEECDRFETIIGAVAKLLGDRRETWAEEFDPDEGEGADIWEAAVKTAYKQIQPYAAAIANALRGDTNTARPDPDPATE